MSQIKWENLPSEIRHKMLDYQEQQGNTRNPEVFIKKIYSTKEEGGFDWVKTLEQESFWHNILINGKIESFFEKYPKSIPSTKDEFKKGDYIVTLVDAGSCGKINYCSKQKVNDIYLKPCIDTKGHTDNGNRIFDIKDKSNTKWRYATKEEAAEYERIGEPYDVTTLNKPQLIVGKWYKFYWTFTNKEVIIKVKSVPDTVVTTSFRVYLDTKDIKSNSEYGYRLKEIKNIKELSLEEIQEYLPEGHPDKVVNKTELHEIHNKSLVGRYFKVLKQFSNTVKKGDYLKITEDLEDGCYNTKEYGCLSQDRLKDKEVELMPEGFEPDNNIIPEYVECIKNTDIEEYGIVGRIYKFNNMSGPSVGVICNLKCGHYSPGNVLYFDKNNLKPSTKEAYDAQFISIQDSFKVGDYVTVLKNPTSWASLLNKNDLRDKVSYPFTGVITKLKKDGSYTAIELVDGGWDLQGLIETGGMRKAYLHEIFLNQKYESIIYNENSQTRSDSFFIKNPCVEIPLKPSVEVELYIKPKQNLLYTEDFKTNELDLPTLIKPKKSLLINL